MTFDSNPSDLTQPLSVGNVVNGGFRLYRSNLKPYLKVSAIGTLWALIPVLAIIPVVLFYVTTQRYYNLLGLIVPAWLLLVAYCSAQYMANSAAIARLAFGELINQPETIKAAYRYTSARKWSFVGMGALLSLLYFGVALGMYLIAAILIVIMFASIGGAEFLRSPASAAVINPGLAIFAGLVILAIVLMFIVVFTWFSVRFCVAELPLSVEREATATKTIGRSWELTQKSVWRIFIILLVTFLVTLPIQFLVQVVATMAQGAIAAFYPQESSIFLALTYAFTYLLGLATGIIVMPLWQTIKAVIYYDLRSRREGLGLQLRDPEPLT